MPEVLPAVNSIEELTKPENGALFWLEPRQSLHNLKPPEVALGDHADFAVAYYKKEFAPRQDRPFIAYFKNPLLYGRHFSILDSQRHSFTECVRLDRRWKASVPKRHQHAEYESAARSWHISANLQRIPCALCAPFLRHRAEAHAIRERGPAA